MLDEDNVKAGRTGGELVLEAPVGALRGTWEQGVARFCGIPFAAAPTGELRFRPPQPLPPWSGVLDARDFGAVSPQNPSMIDALFGGEPERWDEDCLHLNVWSASPEPTSSLPVMVWIHGGGFEIGSGSSPLYDGTTFARSGVVYVSINYRLASLGFLELGRLDADLAGSGNVGLLDQVAALKWVRDNIASFGGDPANVTVFGESAGAMSTSLLMVMPEARGLFHKVVAQSGSVIATRSPEVADADAEEFLGLLEVDSIAALRDVPAKRLLAAGASLSATRLADPETVLARYGNPLAFLGFRPVADGTTVPTDPLARVASGAAVGVPLLVGTNRDEWNLFGLAGAQAQSIDRLMEGFKVLSDEPEVALQMYQAGHPDATPAQLESALFTDVVFGVPASDLADAQAGHAPVWQYRFDWPSPAFGGLLGAAHAVEIPFVFDIVHDPRIQVLLGAEAPTELAHAMHAAWVSFARDGAPDIEGHDWPERAAGDRPVLCLDETIGLQEDPYGDIRAHWSMLN